MCQVPVAFVVFIRAKCRRNGRQLLIVDGVSEGNGSEICYLFAMPAMGFVNVSWEIWFTPESLQKRYMRYTNIG